MSRLSPALARRLDRLARTAHAFHRWAHHPLCGRYAGEVVRLGRRTRLCRGCTLLALGGAAGLALGLWLPGLPPRVAGWPSAGGGLAALAALSTFALLPRRRGKPGKLLTRALPMGAAVALAVTGLRAATAAGLTLALGALALVLGGAAYYRRRGPDRRACQGCPQAPAGPRCDGLLPIARRERAFQRLAGRWIASETARGG